MANWLCGLCFHITTKNDQGLFSSHERHPENAAVTLNKWDSWECPKGLEGKSL
jgi:hypothetical protein